MLINRYARILEEKCGGKMPANVFEMQNIMEKANNDKEPQKKGFKGLRLIGHIDSYERAAASLSRVRADFLSLQKLLSAILLQKKSIMQVLVANILMRIYLFASETRSSASASGSMHNDDAINLATGMSLSLQDDDAEF